LGLFCGCLSVEKSRKVSIVHHTECRVLMTYYVKHVVAPTDGNDQAVSVG
jgi:hypothetical protein